MNTIELFYLPLLEFDRTANEKLVDSSTAQIKNSKNCCIKLLELISNEIQIILITPMGTHAVVKQLLNFLTETITAISHTLLLQTDLYPFPDHLGPALLGLCLVLGKELAPGPHQIPWQCLQPQDRRGLQRFPHVPVGEVWLWPSPE